MVGRKSREKVGLCLHYARIFGAQINVVGLLGRKEDAKVLAIQSKQLIEFITDHGVDVTVHIEEADGRSLPKALLDYNKYLKGDIIVIMEDESVVPFHLWSSDLEEVMYNADVPVLKVTFPVQSGGKQSLYPCGIGTRNNKRNGDVPIGGHVECNQYNLIQSEINVFVTPQC